MVTPFDGGREAATVRPPFDLARLIHPVTVDEFAADYWEKKPLLVRRNDPDYYTGLLSLADMDQVLATSTVRSGDLRILNKGVETPLERLLSPSAGGQPIALETLYEQYRSGSTVAVNLLHERYEPLTRLCRALAREFSSKFQTNVYLTPGGKERGLDPHYDTHDVFVLQTYGSKHWCLYESPTRLPLRDQLYSAEKAEKSPPDPIREFDLETGDLLYMPRGTVHAATSNKEASLHLTIGVLPILWSDVLQDCLSSVVDVDERFRESVPLGFVVDEAARRATAERLTELIGALHEQIPVGEIVEKERRKAMLSRQTALRGHLLDLESLECVELDTPVRRRPELMWDVTVDERRVTLEFHGKSIRLPAEFADELKFATETESFTGRDIPGPLDDEGRMTLVHTLVREGFLTLT